MQMSQAAVSQRGWTSWSAEHLEASFMWRARPGTWTSALAAPAGRAVSCATPRCVLRLSARRPSETRIPAATFAQVIKVTLKMQNPNLEVIPHASATFQNIHSQAWGPQISKAWLSLRAAPWECRHALSLHLLSQRENCQKPGFVICTGLVTRNVGK